MSLSERLQEVVNRCAGYTEGPWVYNPSFGKIQSDKNFDVGMVRGLGKPSYDADGYMLASAPQLLALATEQQQQIEGLRSALERVRSLAGERDGLETPSASENNYSLLVQCDLAASESLEVPK